MADYEEFDESEFEKDVVSDSIYEVAPEEPTKAKGLGEDYKEADLNKFDIPDAVCKNAIDYLIGLPSVDYWFPFSLLGPNKDLKKNPEVGKCDHILWKKWIPFLYSKAQYDETMASYDFMLLVRAGVRLVSCVRFVLDDGEMSSALIGRCFLKFDPATGRWSWCSDVDNLYPYIVKISAMQAVSHQIWCAAVKIGTDNAQVAFTKEDTRNVGVAAIQDANEYAGANLSKHIKRWITPLLKLKDGEKVTESVLEKANLWIKAVAREGKTLKLPVWTMSASLAYFTVYRQIVPYSIGKIDINDCFTQPYYREIKECFQGMLSNSMWKSGERIPGYAILALGIQELHCKHLGGELPNDLCQYNLTAGVTWERDGATLGDPVLQCKVEAVRSVGTFDGIWYSPNGASSKALANAKGLIVPYDSKGHGIGYIKNWRKAANHTDATAYHIFVTFGEYPCFWIETVEPGSVGAVLYSDGLSDYVWKTMVGVAFYNFNCCLVAAKIEEQETPARKAAYKRFLAKKEIAHRLCWGAFFNGAGRKATHFVGKKEKEIVAPKFEPMYLADDYIPGRHVPKSAALNANEQATKTWDNYDAFAASLTRDFEVGKDSEEPTPKRRRAADSGADDEGMDTSV